jgi:hypothetical protein
MKLKKKEADVAYLILQAGAEAQVDSGTMEYGNGKVDIRYPFNLTQKEWDTTIDTIYQVIRSAEIEGIKF